MKYLMTLLVFASLQTVPAQAGWLDALGDVMSLGMVGHERDRTRGEMARIIALEKQIAAEKLKAQQIESLLKQNAIIGADLRANQEVLKGLNLLTELVGSQEGFMLQVFTILFDAQVEAEVFTKLIVLQQQQLMDFLDAYKKGDPNNQGIQSVQQLVSNFTDQVKDFPIESLNKDTIDELIYQSLQSTNMVIQVLDETKVLVKNRIAQQQADIKRNEERRKKLKEKPKPITKYAVDRMSGFRPCPRCQVP